MPRPVPRIVTPGKPGVVMSVKPFGVELQPSFEASPKPASASVYGPATPVQMFTGRALEQAAPPSVTTRL